jgi:hypothetical protein
MHSQPSGQLTYRRGLRKSLIAQNDSPIVMSMPYDPTDGLINGPIGLLIVPDSAGVWFILVEELSLEHDPWIGVHRVGYSRNDHSAAIVVGKVNAFANFAAAYSKKDGALFVALDLLIVLGHRFHAFLGAFGLDKNGFLVADLLPLVGF